MKNALLRRAVTAAFLTIAALGAAPASAQELNLYTTREPGLITPLIEAFTKSTGIKVNTIFVKDGLPERLAALEAKADKPTKKSKGETAE